MDTGPNPKDIEAIQTLIRTILRVQSKVSLVLFIHVRHSPATTQEEQRYWSTDTTTVSKSS